MFPEFFKNWIATLTFEEVNQLSDSLIDAYNDYYINVFDRYILETFDIHCDDWGRFHGPHCNWDEACNCKGPLKNKGVV